MTYLLEDNDNKYLLKENIGSGATCECYIGHKIDEETPELFAIKIFPKKYYTFYSNEIKFLSKLKENDNIIKLYGYGQGFFSSKLNDDSISTEEPNKKIIYYQILEYANNGELKDYIHETSSRIPEKISAALFIKIVKAVKYLHENNIAHCDIKPENILLDHNFNPKLSDFGFSQEFDGKNGNFLLHNGSGTPIYSSPDVRLASTKGYDGIKNDIFSLGVLLFVMTIGDFPFESATYKDEKYKYIIKGRFNRFWEFFNLENISDEFKNLINNLIILNPTKRLSIDKILKHPWFIKNLGINYDEQNNENIEKEIIDEFHSRKIFM